MFVIAPFAPAGAQMGDAPLAQGWHVLLVMQEVKAVAMKKHLLVSAVALVDIEGNVLLGKRLKGKHMADMWEFPGGKVEAGETPEHALIRELKEELNIDVQESCLAPFTFITHEYEEFTLLLLLYLCRKWKGVVEPMEYQSLIWKRPNEMADLPMPPADVPLVAMLRDFL